MREARQDAPRLALDRRLPLECHGTTVTGDAGLLARRELSEALDPTSTIDSELRDKRTGQNSQYGNRRFAGGDPNEPAWALKAAAHSARRMCRSVPE